MKKYLIVLLLLLTIFVGIKVYGVQKYYCIGNLYIPGQSAESFCKTFYHTSQEYSQEINQFMDKEYKDCLTGYFVQVKNSYNSGQCEAVKEIKYTDDCGASCTKVTNFAGKLLSNYCVGGNSQCLKNRLDKANKAMDYKFSKVGNLYMCNYNTDDGWWHSFDIEPSKTSSQYCEYDKSWGNEEYNKCVKEYEKDLQLFRTLNPKGKCVLIKEKTLQYGTGKCTVQYYEKSGKNEYRGYEATGLEKEQAEKCVETLKSQLLIGKVFQQKGYTPSKPSGPISKPKSSTNNNQVNNTTKKNVSPTKEKQLNWGNGFCKLSYNINYDTNSIVYVQTSYRGISGEEITKCKQKIKADLKKEFETPIIKNDKKTGLRTYTYGICKCSCPYYYQYDKLKIKSDQCQNLTNYQICQSCTTKLKEQIK
ncbi:hypothetical protein IJ541_05675 [bacterium]|nr:hypothetical protein [bacterium]